MPSYRFCRPDDIPFLVRAVNTCFDIHFPDRPPLTVDGFRREMKHLDLWPSSSLIAAEGDEPVAVLTGTKRDDETLISRVGVRPGAERDGHGGHLITSLGQKLAVLGPPRLAAEVPASRPAALAFFRTLGWEDDGVYVDLERAPGGESPEPPPAGLVGEVTVAELDAAGALEPDRGSGVTAWERRPASLRGRAEALRGAAIVSPDRVEAWVLWEPREASLDVAAWGCAEPPSANGGRRSLLLSLLLRHLSTSEPDGGASGRALRLVKTGPGEIPDEVVAELGLRPAERSHRLITEAQPL